MLDRIIKKPGFMLEVFEVLRDGLMIVDTEGRIVYINRSGEVITGRSRDELIGKPCTILDGDTCVVSTDSGRERNCELFKTGSVINKRCRIRSGEGKSVYILKNAAVLRNGLSEVIGAVESITDITPYYVKEVELEGLKQELRRQYWFNGMLGRSGPMQRLYDQILSAAASEAPVLVCGDSGTGKNLVANAIHSLSSRSNGPMIEMTRGSFNDYFLESELTGNTKNSTGEAGKRIGKFEASNGGSLFLEEIGDLPVLMQATLLRVLEEKVVERAGENKHVPADVRLISSTSRDLYSLVASGSFREDLLFRASAIMINVPPLRERTEDIPLLVLHYLKGISHSNRKPIRAVSSLAMDIITNFRWPGNVRQLISVLEHAALVCKGDVIGIDDLPYYVIQEEGGGKTGRQEEGHHIDKEKMQAALSIYRGNKTLAARHLMISRVTLWKKMKEFGLSHLRADYSGR